MELKELIKKIERDKFKVKYKKLLIYSLNELNNLIGMNKIKKKLALQIQTILNNQNTFMLNTVIYGGPGVGKSVLGIIMAKIWLSIGYLKMNKVEETSENGKVIMLLREYEKTINSRRETTLVAWIFLSITLLAVFWPTMNSLYNTYKTPMIYVIGIIIVISVFLIGFYYTRKLLNNDNITNNIVNDITFEDDIIEKKIPLTGIIINVSRNDFVSKYAGQTVAKTYNLLNNNRGKLIFIDEAYSLVSSENDIYGMEALTTINGFMSTYPEEIVIVMAGYKEKMSKLFKYQEGLKRRFMWYFECPKYSDYEIGRIFIYQLEKYGIKYNNKTEIINYIAKNKSIFKYYGGDTEKLVNYSLLYLNKNGIDVLNIKHISKGLKQLIKNNLKNCYEGKSDNDIQIENGFSDVEINQVAEKCILKQQY